VKDNIVITTDQVQTLLGGGGSVVDQDGGKVGKVEQVFLDDHADSSDAPESADKDVTAGDRADLAGQPGVVGQDTSGPTTDQAMTRSEEQLRVGTQTREAGKVRLRKYVVTENVTQTVPVSREEIRIEREPITDANRGQAMAGGDITEEEHEVTLHEEHVVVDREVVPVERVRMDTETVTDQAQVDEDVRKEQIEVDDAAVADPTHRH
jgi:uncharacterized protein (TIGR02271 family)